MTRILTTHVGSLPRSQRAVDFIFARERGEAFDPEKHRDPGVIPPLATVVIDFGMVRATRVPKEAGGRFVAGTAGYIAPEQVLDPVELDPRADVYALAGTLYNVTTGRAFFDEIEANRDRIIAHMQQDPMENLEKFKMYPAAIVKLMKAGTAQEWKDLAPQRLVKRRERFVE